MCISRGSEQAPIEPLRGRTVAVIGYGNQGHAHALNLRDSGLRVVVGCRPGSKGAGRAASDGFDPHSIPDAVGQADLAIIALPDEVQAGVFQDQIAPSLRNGSTVGFLHGFALRFGLVRPAPGFGVVLVAPKGPGATLRWRFQRGEGIPCLFAVHQDSPDHDAEAVGLAWASGIGCARAAILRTSIADETETDLFGEQAVLCGGMTALIVAAFETLVSAGYPPELAYLECCHEVKQVADLVYERGLAGMMAAISNTAEFGAYHAGRKLVDQVVRDRLDALLQDIRDGEFAKVFTSDHARGFEWFRRNRQAIEQHPIELAGRSVRSLMPWLDAAGRTRGSVQAAPSPGEGQPT